jgi:limonene-1,2-epoxide hydrolase
VSDEADNKTVVRAFLKAWERLDPDELVSYFTADAVYHNMPRSAVAGTDAIRQLLTWILARHDSLNFDIVTLVAAGDLVVAERVDHLRADDIHIALPVVGIFEMRDSRIAAWRDYFDPTPVEPLLAVLQRRQARPV